MLNILWPIFIIISYIYAFFSGNLEKINTGIFESSKSAVELSLTFIGTVTMWCGIMQIAKESSLSKKISKFLNPLIHYLFPGLDKQSKVYDEISLNITANMLGLGNAATPLGIKAIQSLEEINPKKSTLSNSMIMLVLLNTASLQLIPTTVIAIRSSLNSQNPTSIILPVWLSTICAAIAGILSVKLFIKLGK